MGKEGGCRRARARETGGENLRAGSTQSTERQRSYQACALARLLAGSSAPTSRCFSAVFVSLDSEVSLLVDSAGCGWSCHVSWPLWLCFPCWETSLTAPRLEVRGQEASGSYPATGSTSLHRKTSPDRALRPCSSPLPFAPAHPQYLSLHPPADPRHAPNPHPPRQPSPPPPDSRARAPPLPTRRYRPYPPPHAILHRPPPQPPPDLTPRHAILAPPHAVHPRRPIRKYLLLHIQPLFALAIIHHPA